MKTNKNLSLIGAAILMAVSMSSVHAEDGDMTRTRTQTQVSIDNALQAQKRSQNQHQYKYNYRNNYQTQQAAESRGSMSHQMNASRSGMGGGRKK